MTHDNSKNNNNSLFKYNIININRLFKLVNYLNLLFCNTFRTLLYVLSSGPGCHGTGWPFVMGAARCDLCDGVSALWMLYSTPMSYVS